MDEDTKTIDVDSFFGKLNSIQGMAESAIFKSDTNFGIINEQKSLIEDLTVSIEGIQSEIREINNYIIIQKDEDEDRRVAEEDAKQKQEMTDRAKGLSSQSVDKSPLSPLSGIVDNKDGGDNKSNTGGGLVRGLALMAAGGVANTIGNIGKGISGFGKGIASLGAGIGSGVGKLFKRSAESTVPKEGDTIMSGKGMFGPESEDKENFISKFFNRKKKEIKEEIKEEIDVVDTKKGEVQGVEPSKPKRQRDEVGSGEETFTVKDGPLTTTLTEKNDDLSSSTEIKTTGGTTNKSSTKDKIILQEKREKQLEKWVENPTFSNRRADLLEKLNSTRRTLNILDGGSRQTYKLTEEQLKDKDFKLSDVQFEGSKGDIMPSAMSPISEEDLARERSLSNEEDNPLSAIENSFKEKTDKFAKSPLGKAMQSEEVPKFLEGMSKSFGGLINPENVKNTVVGKVKNMGMNLSEPLMEKVDDQFGQLLSIMGASDVDNEPMPQPQPQNTPTSFNALRQSTAPQVAATPIRSSESTVPFINLMQQESRKQLNIVKQGQSNLPLEVVNFINKIK